MKDWTDELADALRDRHLPAQFWPHWAAASVLPNFPEFVRRYIDEAAALIAPEFAAYVKERNRWLDELGGERLTFQQRQRWRWYSGLAHRAIEAEPDPSFPLTDWLALDRGRDF